MIIRNPNATRPWQHILEVLYGYLKLAIELKKNKKINGEAFNFGPQKKQVKNVIALLKEAKKNWSSATWVVKKNIGFSKSKLLKLNSNKSNKKLKWSNKLSFSEMVGFTVDWYKKYYNNQNMLKYSINQIKRYEEKK